ncbi:tRNA (guanine-N(7)-)-methyltransferase non-catalytic subunit trm82 [Lachnellula suecica]|uniref:tRNA (Guanine-N(7)-)-methyltransferase non-catalytic subunit trm82 n=1 Tax=Lachnellula suecica TaxID=602035 RepID=A0A8T9CGQ2_9HELO|nr:tRNA (guanine-N(7)-)-methyltransferase non-catalytic subunit trm82 [Lachnellula suecica]
MPKRPCALTITDDNTTILSADKFGDVYSLPLLTSTPPEASKESSQVPDQLFKPSANELTIHSQRNRKALENQKRQNKVKTEKSGPEFEHSLLLGHVSLLTDVKLAKSGERTYVITADRDEHIRVSRGIPKAHIIENFCLGHKEFISRICIPGTRPEILISGGGDDELYVWDWEKGLLISKAELRSLVERFTGDDKVGKVAVSGIYHTRQGEADIIIVTIEGVSALFTFSLGIDNTLKQEQTLELGGNVLAAVTGIEAPDGTTSRVLVSVDGIHRAGSTTELRDSTEEPISPFQTFSFANGVLTQDSFAIGASEESEVAEGVMGGLRNLLYSLENLRKRDGEEGGKEEDAVMVEQGGGNE